MKEKNKSNISFFPKSMRINLNVGVVVFFAVFCYLIIILIMFLSQKHISIYEVRQGSIYNHFYFHGFIIRDEEIYPSGNSGYINFLVHEGAKVGAQTPVYAISESPLKLGDVTNNTDSRELSYQDKYILFQKINTFVESYDAQNFFDIYSLKDSLDSTLENSYSTNKKNQLQTIMTSGTESVDVNYSGRDGIISYIIDGHEDTTIDSYMNNPVTSSDYSPVRLEDDSPVSESDNVFKLIRGDQWNIIFPIDEKFLEIFSDINTVKVKFLSDQQTDTADVSVMSKNDQNFAVLTLNTSMVRYEKNRFIDIELIMEDQTGLKIPKTSFITKDCYPVDPAFLIHNEITGEKSVMVKDEEGEIVENSLGICLDKDQNVYLDSGIYPKGTLLVSPDKTNTLPLDATQKISGVYNVNKGYAVFTNVRILAENEEYYIVEEGSGYTLSNYDHIVLNAGNVTDNEIVFN